MGRKPWNPYLAGALTGLLLVLSVWISGHFFGASTTFPRSSAVIERALGIDPGRFAYFTVKKGKYGPDSLPNWQLLFLVGIFLGAGGAALFSGDFKLEATPPMWRQRFGPGLARRAGAAVFGGALAMVGARLAGG